MVRLLTIKKDYFAFSLLLCFSLVGVILILFCTSMGIGLSPDSTTYIGMARSLLDGRGFSLLAGDGGIKPHDHYPPLFSAVLATIGVFKIDPLVGARWLNALLFGINILLVGLLIYWFTSGSFWSAGLGSLFMLTSLDMISIHSVAWTEPMFIALSLIGLLLLSAYLGNYKPTFLVASSAAIALALLTRYAGLPLVPTGIASLLLFSRETYYRRIIDSIVFSTLCFVPLALWMMRNLYVAGSLTGRKIGFHPITYEHIKSAMDTLSSWLLPWKVSGTVGAFVLPLAVITILVTICLMLPKVTTQHEITYARRAVARLPQVLVTFVLIYTAFLIVSISTIQIITPLDHRILAPIFVSGLVLLFCQGPKFLRYFKKIRFLQVVLILLPIALLGSYIYRSSKTVSHYHRNGRGYANRYWKHSEITQKVRTLPSGIRIYSNGPDAIYILTGRPSYMIPNKLDKASGNTNDEYLSQLARMEKDLENHPSVLVYFNKIHWRWYLPSEDELKETLSLKVSESGADGSIYIAHK